MNIHKRQKVQSTCEQLQNLSSSAFDKTYQSYTLDTLPPEILEMVLRFLPFHDVASAVRLVSRHCSTIAIIVLNGAFLAAGTKLENVIKRIKATMSKLKTNRDILGCIRTLNALDVIKVQYKMLRAVTWRYTHPSRKQKFSRLCFYGGSLLDALNNLLSQAEKCPINFIGSHAIDSCIAYFLALCKRFMNFFEKVSERRVNRSALVSGCKIVDVLDCLIEGRQVLTFKVSTNHRNKTDIVNMRLKYMMKRAWFTCLNVPKNADENLWCDKQRFMYLRLRRLVGSVNEHLLESLHYEKELHLQVQIRLPLRPPPISTYSGYGEYDGLFFYYGNMNKYAYENKFVDTNELVIATAETEEEVQRSPCFDLTIEIELRCSPDLAPFAIRSMLNTDQFEKFFTTKSSKRQEFFLKMDITCPASMANRLPDRFTWELCSPQRPKRFQFLHL